MAEGADAGVVDAHAGKTGEVSGLVERHAHDGEVSEQGTGRGGRGVGAAEVDAVGFGAECDLWRIVDDKRRAVVTAEFGDRGGFGTD
jgi:hypothetical protein